jgi:hypothetical protein
MPNHCETDVVITGPADVIEAIRAAHFTPDGALDCGSLIPYPEEYRTKDEAARAWAEQYTDGSGFRLRPEYQNDPNVPPRPTDGFNSGGYEWCCTNWGTKWGTYDPAPLTLTRDEDGQATIRASFTSAWSPPTPVLGVLAERYPVIEMEADSYEGGCQYHISAAWGEGMCYRDEEHPYSGPRGG